MNIVILLLVCSLVLVAGSIVLFVFSARQGDCHEAERLCLMPLDDDEDNQPSRASDTESASHLSEENHP